ncbi:universal stress protein [Geodermatophilus sp. YIM 151500]|uniref:universal stress protein n=1 Tax=Geodermatophilus sp. YIM 151500 TaxID=2984531 RepID=UPI0021E46E6D|nr:universal stress protein [Geodermatophilus sp. YIM 151500]MCV2487875.1 universal stress protein [Geodermatophilus sp. YIM 151500]
MGTPTTTLDGVAGRPYGAGRGRVVVGVDASDGARAALVWALAEAAHRGVPLDVVTAYPVDFYWTDAYLADRHRLDAVRDLATTQARALVDEVRGDPALAGVPGVPVVPVDVVVVGGAPADHLVAAAGPDDVLVVGSRGRGAVRGAVLGSVSLRCVMHSRGRVVVVHPDRAVLPGGRRAVVIGFDGSAAARSALLAAVDEATLLGTDLRVVVVLEPAEHWTDLGTATAESTARVRDVALRQAREAAAEVLGERLLGEGGETGPRVDFTAVEGRPAAVLVDEAADAALLVVGNRGHGTLPGLLLGSVALLCVVHAPCPVMVLHSSADRGVPAERAGSAAARA